MGRRIGFFLGLLILCAEAHAATDRGFSLSVVVDGAPLSELYGRGSTYVEAQRGKPYALRITNPFPYRVGVALSVDGLNTIDAKHSDAWRARKWVLDPGESTTIPGWQVSGSTAREFFFTGERSSYGASLGLTENLGVIEAVFFRERPADRAPITMAAPAQPSGGAPMSRRDAAAPNAEKSAAAEALSDDYAATGMGRRGDHEVHEVFLDLERNPVGSLRVRYEFRPQLVKLGLLPREWDSLERREASRGFSSYCPEPGR